MITLPSDFLELSEFIKNNKDKLHNSIISEIKKKYKNKFIKLYMFKNSKFGIILTKESYLPNLQHILNYRIKNELYESCKDVTTVIDLVSKFQQSPTKSEKSIKKSKSTIKKSKKILKK